MTEAYEINFRPGGYFMQSCWDTPLHIQLGIPDFILNDHLDRMGELDREIARSFYGTPSDSTEKPPKDKSDYRDSTDQS